MAWTARTSLTPGKWVCLPKRSTLPCPPCWMMIRNRSPMGLSSMTNTHGHQNHLWRKALPRGVLNDACMQLPTEALSNIQLPPWNCHLITRGSLPVLGDQKQRFAPLSVCFQLQWKPGCWAYECCCIYHLIHTHTHCKGRPNQLLFIVHSLYLCLSFSLSL